MTGLSLSIRTLVSLTAACTCCMSAIAQATFEGDWFTVVLPEKWVIIPDEQIQAANARLQQQFQDQSTTYQYGFQHDDSKNWFEYPYILVRLIPGRVSDELLGQLSKLSEGLSDEIVDSNLGRDMNVSSAETTYDAKRKILWLSGEMGEAGAMTKSLTAQLFTPNGILEFSLNTTAPQFERYTGVFRDLIASTVVSDILRKQPIDTSERVAGLLEEAFIAVFLLLISVSVGLLIFCATSFLIRLKSPDELVASVGDGTPQAIQLRAHTLRSRVRYGAVAAGISITLTAAGGIILLTTGWNSDFFTPLLLVDAVFMLTLLVGLLRGNRLAASILFAHYLLSQVQLRYAATPFSEKPSLGTLLGDFVFAVIIVGLWLAMLSIHEKWRWAQIEGGQETMDTWDRSIPGRMRHYFDRGGRPWTGVSYQVVGALLYAGAIALVGYIVLVRMNSHAAAAGESSGNPLVIPRIFEIAIAATLSSAAGWLMYRGKQLRAPTVEQVLKKDGRPPILYLRSFAADRQYRINWMAISGWFGLWYQGRTEEEELTLVLRQFGPVIAIGRPGEPLPEVGAARMYVGAKEWQDTVNHWLGKASFVFMRAGSSEGFMWEIGQVLARCDPKRVILYLAAARPVMTSQKQVDEDYAIFRKRANELLPHPLGEKCAADLFVVFDDQWYPNYISVLEVSIWKRMNGSPLDWKALRKKLETHLLRAAVE